MLPFSAQSARERRPGRHRAASGGGTRTHREKHGYLRGAQVEGSVLRSHRMERLKTVTEAILAQV